MSSIHSTTLDNGLTVLVEAMGGVRSAAVSCLVPAGGARDPHDRIGRATVWAELLMRGSQSLDARAQADAFDRAGAARSTDGGNRMLHVSASTIDDQVGGTLGLLFDMVRTPRFDADSLEPTRALALSALAAVDDDPQQRAAHAARARHFPSPINRTGLGTREGLAALTHDELMEAWPTCAVPDSAILAVAGAVDPGAVIDRVRALSDGWAGGAPSLDVGGAGERGYGHLEDESNQVQVFVMCDAPAERDPDSVYERLAAAVLSGGMSGRLFTEVREKRGLCYAVSAAYRPDVDRGSTTAYVGTTPERAQEALDVLVAEMRRLGTPGAEVTRDEFDRAIVGLKSGLVFSGESTGARASAIAIDWFRLGRARTLAERADEFDSVTLDGLNAYLARRGAPAMTVQTLGPAALTPPEGV